MHCLFTTLILDLHFHISIIFIYVFFKCHFIFAYSFLKQDTGADFFPIVILILLFCSNEVSQFLLLGSRDRCKKL